MTDSISLILSLGAVGISLYFGYHTLRIQRIQQKIDLLASRDQYFQQLHQWSQEVGRALTEAAHLGEMKSLPDGENRFPEERRALRVRLSALADEGRYFFPNLEHPTLGAEKDAPFQGVRHPAIDPLIFAYDALGNAKKTDESLKTEIIKHKKKILAEIHQRLAPKQREKQYKIFMEGYQSLLENENSAKK
jgi:hypothetical protein